MNSFSNHYNGAKVLVTGHTGFKGAWLCQWLVQLGAKVSGISIDVPSEPSHFISAGLNNKVDDYRLDIRDGDKLKKIIKKIQPDYVFHLAAQSLVRVSYERPIETMSTNAMGSVYLLEALRSIEKDVVAVMITSDKAYDNVEWVWGYRETDRLGGKDPYSASKGMAELAIRSYVESLLNTKNSKIIVGIARAGNVIGGGDWAQNRIVPDCVKAWSDGKIVNIRSPLSTRPWQHVLEPISGYLHLGVMLDQNKINNGEAYNFGPPANQNFSVKDLINEMSQSWENVKWSDISTKNTSLHEAELLKLNCDKALFDLNWTSTLKFDETVRMTIEWYKEFYEVNEASISEISNKQIYDYSLLAKDRNITWAI
jgi:CDP-glucose 4,6-dehydratase|tara:strand:- start:641 stop:1744 length:1104 start_codon:yes stop_codon:yes gene_type:complete